MLDQPGTKTGHDRDGPARGREYAVAALVLAAIAVALVSPAMRPGHILAPVDLVFESPGYASQAPAGFEEPSNPHLFDQTYQFVPWRHYAWHSLRDGRLPLWNPLSAAGTPFAATMQAAVFYPVNLLMLTLPFSATFAASALLRLWIAGFATYLLLRRYGASHHAGLLSGTSFMLCGFIVVWLGHPHTNVAIWLPALLFALEGLVGAANARNALRWWAALAVVIGVQFLGGHIETSHDLLLAGAVYLAIRLTQRWDLELAAKGRRLLAAGAAVLVGAGIAAIQLAPFIEWLPLSAEYRERAGFQFGTLNYDVHQFLALPLAVMPNLYGNPTWDGPYWSFNPWGSFNESVLYAGLVPLGLAIAALPGWRADPLIRCWSIMGGIFLCLALRLPLVDWFSQLPGNALSHPDRLRLIATFSVAVLAGRGLDRLKAGQAAAASRRWLMRALVAALAFSLAFAVVGGIGLHVEPERGADFVRYGVDRYGSSTSPPRSIIVCRERVDACGREIVDAFALSNWRMYLPLVAAASALVVLWMSRRRPAIRAQFAPALIAITAIELILTGLGYNPALPSEQLFPAGPALATAAGERSDARVTVLQQDTLPDSHMLHGFADVRGLDFKTARYERYLDASGDRIPWLANGVLLSDAGPLIAALDVETVLTSNPHIVERKTSEGTMRAVASEGDLTILEPTRHVERAAMVFDVEIAPDDEATARMLADDPERIFERVILTDSADARHAQASVTASDPAATVEPAILEPVKVAWDVQTEAPGVLVIADAYYPGWAASIDGDPTEIMRANLAFRAVLIPPGAHRVEMRYEPRSFRLGAIITALSTAVVLGLLVVTFTPAFRRRG